MTLRERAKGYLKMQFPRTPPYNNAGDYLHSKAYLEQLTFRNYEWDKPRHDPELHLTAGRRVLESTTEALADRREWAKKERVKLEEQWKDLYEKEQKFKETFTMLSQFIRSNEDKRKRAEQIRQEDYNLRLQRTENIKILQEKFAVLLESKKEMDDNISKLKMYEQYLNRVVSASADFRNADDLIGRYEALVATRNILGIRQDQSLKELETARAKTARMAEEMSFKILGLNNNVAELNARYNSANLKALHWEKIVETIRSQMFKRYQEQTQVKQSCWNMYLLMCKRKSEVPKIAEDDFEKQLIYIKQTLQDLSKIKTIAKSEGVQRKLQKEKHKAKRKE